MITAVLVSLISISSCKKNNFDSPPHDYPDLAAGNITIDSLKSLYTGGSPITITADLNITAIVIADDKSGNFYKTIVIDDGTAGLQVLIDNGSLYPDFPVGRKININCKGLVLGTYAGNTQLGGFIDLTAVGNIPQALIKTVFTKGSLNNDITSLIQHTTIQGLNNSMNSRLVELDSVEFEDGSLDKPYADVYKAIPASGDRYLHDCSNNSIDARTSNFAKFAFSNVPRGKGTLLAIYTVYNSTKQLVIRDTTDLHLTGFRCDGSDPNARPIFSENFEAMTYLSTTITNWDNIAVAGSKVFKVNNAPSSQNNQYVQMSAFGGTSEPSNITWLVSPSINLDASTNEILSFRSAAGFYRSGTNFEVFISTNYSGDPTTATWAPLSAIIPSINTTPPSGNTFTPFTSSGPVDISGYSGSVHIGFKYTGSGTGNQTTTFEIDDVKVTGI